MGSLILGVELAVPFRGVRHAARSPRPRRHSHPRRRLAAPDRAGVRAFARVSRRRRPGRREEPRAGRAGIKFDEKELILTVCWTGEIGRSFHPALDVALENLGPYCYEAVEVDVTMYHDNGEQDSRLLFVGPTAQAIHEAQRRCMVEDVAAVLARQFDKDKVGEVTALVNDLFDRDWKEKASQQKKPERAFESYTRPSRKNLH